MIGLAAAAILLAPMAATSDSGPLSVAVQASGDQDVSYAIEVHNTTDRAVPDALITQQLPPNAEYIAAIPPARRTGSRLSWTLSIPAHGTASITTIVAADHHLGARPLDPVTQAGTVHRGHHRSQTTTVCAREDNGPQSCATGRGALLPTPPSRWGRGTLAAGSAAVALAALLGGAGLWRWRRRRLRAAGASGGPDALERAGVEG